MAAMRASFRRLDDLDGVLLHLFGDGLQIFRLREG